MSIFVTNIDLVCRLLLLFSPYIRNIYLTESWYVVKIKSYQGLRMVVEVVEVVGVTMVAEAVTF